MKSHQVVENLGHLAAGDVAVGLEAAVTVAVDDPLSRHGADVVVGIAGDLATVGEGQRSLYRFRSLGIRLFLQRIPAFS